MSRKSSVPTRRRLTDVDCSSMMVLSGWYAGQLRRELVLRNRRYARGRAHVESYGDPPVIVYAPEN
ncbi:MAG: hypothetical protein WBE38_08880, partial [Terracidiphilus sp.]